MSSPTGITAKKTKYVAAARWMFRQMFLLWLLSVYTETIVEAITIISDVRVIADNVFRNGSNQGCALILACSIDAARSKLIT
jgi:hypothetical protein